MSFDNSYESCLISRLSRYVDLNGAEKGFLAEVEKDERRRTKNSHVFNVGDQTDGIVVLKSGWAVVRADAPDGNSQILRIYLPGEVMGLAEIASLRADHRIVMQTDGVVCPFPRSGLTALLTDYPRLTALLMAVGSLDQIALRYHAAALSAMDATGRLKFFLLQLRSRLEVANVGLGNRFPVPLSQSEIGQAIGLTSIYVNKLLRRFVQAGEIEIDRPHIRLLEWERWEKEIDFVNPFKVMDTSWFPSTISTDPEHPEK